MSPRLGRLAFQLGVWLGLLSAVAVVLAPPGSAERLVAVAALGVSAVFMAVVAVVVRRSG